MHSLIVHHSLRCRFKKYNDVYWFKWTNSEDRGALKLHLRSRTLSTAFIHSPFPSYVPSDLQLSFLFFTAWITFSSTTASTTGSANWCWQLELKLQPRHLTEQSSRGVSAAKCNRQPKQFHHLTRSRSWNAKHHSTVGLGALLETNRIRRGHSLWSSGTSVRDRGGALACQGLKYVHRMPLCSVERLYEVVYGSVDIFEIKHSSGLIIFPWVKVKLTHQPTLLPTGWMTFLHLIPFTTHYDTCTCVTRSKTIALQ